MAETTRRTGSHHPATYVPACNFLPGSDSHRHHRVGIIAYVKEQTQSFPKEQFWLFFNPIKICLLRLLAEGIFYTYPHSIAPVGLGIRSILSAFYNICPKGFSYYYIPLCDKDYCSVLRKLFARTFYGVEKNIAKITDVIGHSSINTTCIYILTTGTECRRKIERLGLIV